MMFNKSASRGQAVTETAIMTPLFLLGLFGVFWSIRESSLTERVQLGVRYAGVSQSLANPYAAYSLYSVYAAIDNNSPPGAISCINGNAIEVTGDPDNGSQQLASFWQPLATPLPLMTSQCPSNNAGSLAVLSGSGYSEPFILQNDFVTLKAQAKTQNTSFAQKVFGGATGTTVVATENFFHSPDVGTLVRCSTIGTALKASLEAPVSGSIAVPSSISTPLPSTFAASAVIPSSATTACQNPNQSLFATPISPY